MHPFYLFFDPCFIWFYRLTGSAAANFLLGTFMVAVLSLLVGKITSFLASFLVRRHFEEVTGEAKKYHDLSMEALKAGNRPAYEAANEVANEAFSKSFFMQMALSATFFWPIFLVLGWMQYRFLDMEFPIPGTSWSLGFIGAFIVIYVAAYLLFKQIPSIRSIKAMVVNDRGPDQAQQGSAELSPLAGPQPGK